MISPAYKNMRFALFGRANPKKQAAIMLITSPINVSMFGEIRVRASPFTIFCSSQPLPLPNALVQVKKLILRGQNPAVAASLISRFLNNTSRDVPPNLLGSVMNGKQLKNLELPLAVRRN